MAARFEELHAWQSARQLTNAVYTFTRRPEAVRDFALIDQIRRAALSVMSNIAEGFESRTDKLYVDLLGRARGSAGEVRSQLYVALDQRYISHIEFGELSDLADKTSRQIYRLIQHIEKRQSVKRDA